jgi:cell division protein FtsW
MLIISIAFVVFFMAGVGILWFIKLSLLTIPLVALMVLTAEYRVKRLLSFFFPELDPFDASYQVNAALAALGDGEFWGRGLGNGVRKISSIPEVQSDFIFAVWGEEMGFFGVMIFFALIALFTVRGFHIAVRCTDRFRSLVAIGCVSAIFIQTIMNSGVVARVFPATGIPLPFFSSGGSSLLITLCLCGLVINVSRWRDGGGIENV